MSRDVIAQYIPPEARTVDELPAEWSARPLPFGRSEVIEAVIGVAPEADLTDPSWGHVLIPGADVEVSIPDESPLTHVAFHVRASDDEEANRFLESVLGRLGVRAFDPDTPGHIFRRRKSWADRCVGFTGSLQHLT